MEQFRILDLLLREEEGEGSKAEGDGVVCMFIIPLLLPTPHLSLYK